MKVAYEHLIEFIPSKPSIDDISEKLFQLGHEHEIESNIFDMEFTPNRGDCLSINGLLRELAIFYQVNIERDIYSGDIKSLKIDFINDATKACPNISFLKIDIEGEIKPYKGLLKKYFDDLDIKSNNFFTDISNYISYETGQPTHCYDAQKINGAIKLQFNEHEHQFKTLIGKEIKLKGTNLVFMQKNKIINLAGVMGGIDSSCSNDTKSVIIECAFFNPENILGQSIKYDLKSDAAYKFERGVAYKGHKKVLRRFIKVVSEHTSIKNIEIFQKDYQNYNLTEIPFNLERINSILGISLNKKDFKDYLSKLGLNVEDKKIIIPSYRNDLKTENDIAEEIARVIGYNNIPVQQFNISESRNAVKDSEVLEKNIKSLLIEQGFFEVLNNPFTSIESSNSIKVDNPLDSTQDNIRTNLEKSLIANLLYNERRQHDSIKLFEISDVYYLEQEEIKNKKIIGIICSGRVGKNYIDFSRKIDDKYLKNILHNAFPGMVFYPTSIDRDKLDTKLNNKIIYLEIELDYLMSTNYKISHNEPKLPVNQNSFIKFSPISAFPCSTRDLSFAIGDSDKYYVLVEFYN